MSYSSNRQLSLNRACELQVFTPPKLCLSRRRCITISGVTRTPGIGASFHTRGRWAEIGVSLHLLFLCSELPTRLRGAWRLTVAEGQCHTHLVPKDAPDTCLRCSYSRGWTPNMSDAQSKRSARAKAATAVPERSCMHARTAGAYMLKMNQ